MTRIEVAHTADLPPSSLSAARNLLYDAFDDMREVDWEHCLGGMHALAWVDGELVGHAALIQRRLLHRGRALRTGYVEGVAVRSHARRHGHGTDLMRPLHRIIGAAYQLGALGASEEAVPFYLHLGWQLWQGPSAAMTPNGTVPTPDDDGAIFVLPGADELDLSGEIACDWRDGDAW